MEVIERDQLTTARRPSQQKVEDREEEEHLSPLLTQAEIERYWRLRNPFWRYGDGICF